MQRSRAIERVLDFRLKAAAAAYRIPVDLENVEELFSLASASGGDDLAESMTLAIAATLDFARATATPSNDRDLFTLRERIGASDSGNKDGWTPPQSWIFRGQTVNKEGALVAKTYSIPPYHLYVGLMAKFFNKGGLDRRDTIITFNYDTVLEDTLRELGVPFSHGAEEATGWPSMDEMRYAQIGVKGLRIFKLHGSVSWGRATERLIGSQKEIAQTPQHFVSELDRKIVVFKDYKSLRSHGHIPILVAPTWQKMLVGYLSAVRDAAVEAIKTATRLVIIGYSIPPADQHFRYLLAAGLQSNISLRKVFFVNPALSRQGKTREQLEQRLFGLFRREHFDQGKIELISADMRAFLAGPGSRTMWSSSSGAYETPPSSRAFIGRPFNPPNVSPEQARWIFLHAGGEQTHETIQ